MSKEELWDIFCRARAARLVAREAWDACITSLGGFQTDYWRKLAEADKITENVLAIVREEIER